MLLRSGCAVAMLLVAAVARADPPADPKDKTSWGMAAKVRRSYATPGVQRLLMGDTPGTATMDGAGIDFARRNGSTELVFGFGYDRLDAKEGYYLEKGGDPLVAGKVDYVTFDHPRWYTVEVTVVGHAKIHKFLEFRYGAGIGVGLIRGTVRKTDALCTGPSLQQECMPDPMGVEIDKPANIPPVLPVLNALVGLQLRPFNWLHIHLDAGIHTAPYVGLGVSLYLW